MKQGKRDYEGGETWEEEQNKLGYDQEDLSNGFTGPSEDEMDNEEDRILAQTRAALRQYDDENGYSYDVSPKGHEYESNMGNGAGHNDFVPYRSIADDNTQSGNRMKARQYYSTTPQTDARGYDYEADAPVSPEASSTEQREQRRRQKQYARRQSREQKRAKKAYQHHDIREEEGYVDRQSRRHSRKHKKHHPVRNFFLILLVLIIVVPILWILVQVRTMQSLGMDNEQIQDSIADTVKENIASGGAQGDYKNIAILGVDSVDNSLDSGNNRSDVMIIASINNSTGAIKLMSVYRDTYLDIGDGNYQKANAAYAFGGPDQTVQMLNRNLDLDITDYGVVGFEGIARLIDAVGGVEIDVQEDEIVHLNNYQLTMSEETGLTNIPVTHAGTQTLNGLQATAYCRIRYTSGNDFRRTERQRTVLTKTFEKIKSNPARLIVNLNAILPYVKTSLSVPELFSLGLRAMNFNVESQEGFPSQDLLTVGYINQQSCIIPITLARNVTWLHGELFGETDYQPSDTVQQISGHISAVTGYY